MPHHLYCKVKKEVRDISFGPASYLAESTVELNPEPEYIPELNDHRFKIIQLLEEDAVRKIAAVKAEYLCRQFLTPLDTKSKEVFDNLKIPSLNPQA